MSSTVHVRVTLSEQGSFKFIKAAALPYNLNTTSFNSTTPAPFREIHCVYVLRVYHIKIVSDDYPILLS
jgi:hypothetical protein